MKQPKISNFFFFLVSLEFFPRAGSFLVTSQEFIDNYQNNLNQNFPPSFKNCINFQFFRPYSADIGWILSPISENYSKAKNPFFRWSMINELLTSNMFPSCGNTIKKSGFTGIVLCRKMNFECTNTNELHTKIEWIQIKLLRSRAKSVKNHVESFVLFTGRFPLIKAYIKMLSFNSLVLLNVITLCGSANRIQWIRSSSKNSRLFRPTLVVAPLI